MKKSIPICLVIVLYALTGTAYSQGNETDPDSTLQNNMNEQFAEQLLSNITGEFPSSKGNMIDIRCYPLIEKVISGRLSKKDFHPRTPKPYFIHLDTLNYRTGNEFSDSELIEMKNIRKLLHIWREVITQYRSPTITHIQYFDNSGIYPPAKFHQKIFWKEGERLYSIQLYFAADTLYEEKLDGISLTRIK